MGTRLVWLAAGGPRLLAGAVALLFFVAIAAQLAGCATANPYENGAVEQDIHVMDSTIHVKYPKVCEESSDGQFHPVVDLTVTSGSEEIKVESGNLIVHNDADPAGTSWQGGGLIGPDVIRPGSTERLSNEFGMGQGFKTGSVSCRLAFRSTKTPEGSAIETIPGTTARIDRSSASWDVDIKLGPAPSSAK